MALATVRSLGSPRSLRTEQEYEDYEQELVDQYLLASVGAGVEDVTIAGDRAVLFELIRFVGRPVWTVQPDDADRFLVHQRKVRDLAKGTVHKKAGSIAQFFDFLIARYQGDVHALTGHVLVQPIDEFNRPAKADYGSPRIPPSSSEVGDLFSAWRTSLPSARKYLPAARDYFAASLWRRAGLRIGETRMLDIRDWRPDLGEYGKMHVRHGKGSRGRGPKARLVPAINSVDALVNWWFTDVRHQFGDDYMDPDAPLLPSERRDPHTGWCRRVGDDALRSGLAKAVGLYLPSWSGRLTPHGLRHFCASEYYAQGLDLKAIQELLGHEWLSTTTRYVHVHDDHIEHTWAAANERVAARLGASDGSDTVRWNLRMTAAEQGIWKSTEMRRRLAEAGLEISAGKMSALWTGTPTTVRLDDLDIICAVLGCTTGDLLIHEPEAAAARRPIKPTEAEAGGAGTVTPRLGRNRTLPPA